ncbi:MAG: GNAT family protein [Thermaerobacter sp.]|nr:GNAT family protein [Thermaerobacter sp.]
MALRAEILDGKWALRLLAPQDAEQRLSYLTRNRAFFTPFFPAMASTDFTLSHQRAILEEAARECAADRRYAFGLFGGEGQLVATVTLANVVRGAWRNANLGYSIDQAHAGQGIMTAAVAAVLDFAEGPIGLHRVEAAIMPRNRASIRVVEKNGFQRIGLSPRYLLINGRWEDHLLFFRLSARDEPDVPT